MNTRAFTDLIVTALIAATEPLNAIKIGLYTAPITPSPAKALTDLTEAAFTGYARVAPAAPTGPVNPESQDLSACDYARAIFTCTDPTANLLVYGAFVVDSSTGLVLYAILPFASPVPITGAGASVSVMLQGQINPAIDIFANVLQ